MASLISEATAPSHTGSDATPLFSADSHVIEERSLWDGILPTDYFGPPASDGNARAGRVDPVARVDEMAVDGVSGEVLYPTLALRMFGMEDADLQERCFRRYNDWLVGFCNTSPDKLTGIGLISCYKIDNAVKELERCAEMGLRGCEVWQEPFPEYQFSSRHYDPLWAAAESLSMPVSLHILTGYKAGWKAQGLPTSVSADALETTIAQFRYSVNLKLLSANDALLKIIFSGVLDRFPNLKFVMVENEIGWLPFILDQFDFYAVEKFASGMSKRPSEYFGKQLFATFFRDPVGTKMFEWWGATGCMWSNDYPHSNSTWPNSMSVVEQNLGYLPPATREMIVRGTARRLYGLDK